MYQVVIVLLLIFIASLLPYLLTKQSKYIKVIKKFKINGEIMKIIDDQNTEYLIEETLLISQKKCNEVWELIKEDELNFITYYGFNYPNLGVKYRIINSK